ncbi:MAG: hypothetical protein NVS3B28_07110 [Candidatus Velthaea sp.]
MPVTDSDFEWMIRGEPRSERDLELPPGGVDDVATLQHVRRIVARLHAQGSRAAWMIVCGREVVGLCSFKNAPAAEGEVEIGYGVAALRRGRGHATAAVAGMLAQAQRDPSVRVVLAETVIPNYASDRVLENNGFERTGSRVDAEDGDVRCWRKYLPR